jgi:hypothetical protein
MPAKDGTGPYGYGPRTGFGMGPCGRGYGRGMGFRRFWMPYQPTKEQEIAELKAEKEAIKQELSHIESRLKELESKK